MVLPEVPVLAQQYAWTNSLQNLVYKPLDPTTLPVLLKTLDFLFGEGSKILEERRERRKAQQQETAKEKTTIPPQAGTTPKDVIQSKEAALSQPIAESAWLVSEAEIKHLLSLLEIHTKNYHLAKEQYAKWGRTLVPPIIVHNLTEAENEIAATTKELQAALSKVYGKKVAASEVEQA